MSMNQTDLDKNMQVAENLGQNLENLGKRMDFEIETTMAIELPEGKYGENMMNRLVDALNKYSAVMEFAELAKIEGEQTKIPMEIARIVMAITAAAEDAGKSIDINLSEVATDAELARLIGQIEDLFRDADFQDFLKEEIIAEEEPEEMEDDEVVVEPVDGMDEMFARRV